MKATKQTKAQSAVAERLDTLIRSKEYISDRQRVANYRAQMHKTFQSKRNAAARKEFLSKFNAASRKFAAKYRAYPALIKEVCRPLRDVKNKSHRDTEKLARDRRFVTKTIKDSPEAQIVDSPLHHQLDYIVRSKKLMRHARKNEERLLIAYRNWLDRQGRKLRTARYGKLQCDAFEERRRNLIEAKSSASREHIRMAVGQLLDYAFQIRKKFPDVNMAVLLPRMPDWRAVDWLPKLKIAVIWRENGAFLDSAKGKFSGPRERTIRHPSRSRSVQKRFP
jgi:hypothetical protein